MRFVATIFGVLLLGALGVAGDDDFFTPEKKAHWAWQPPRRLPIPAVKNVAWVQNPIDAFILARLEAKGLTPSPPADPATLLRRLYFDLIGLPPTIQQLDSFLAAWHAPNAKRQAVIAEVVDHLLASPRYGERWGRHWLDLARYADSNGFEFDEVRPDAWRFRDYVIRAFNADKPYDRFLQEQIAGDELFPDDPESRIATGFNLLGPDMTDSSNQAQRRQNTLDDMTETTGLVFMGLTVGCARCHDHKFEPIQQADFYRLQAFFTPAAFRRDVPAASKKQLALHAAAQVKYQRMIQPILDAQSKIEEPYRPKVLESKLARVSEEARAAHHTPEAKRTARQQQLVDQTARLVAFTSREVVAVMDPDDRRKHLKLDEELKQFDGQRPGPLPVAMGLQDSTASIAKTYLLVRGELSHRGQEISAAWPLILAPKQQEIRPAFEPKFPASTGRRTALARWLTDPGHPLTARVMVNRLWQHHFGRGLVATPSDFGLRGQPPSHPELLDWLATEFVKSGWSLKNMHRMMVMSAAYQQESGVKGQESESSADQVNQLLSRMNRRRLEGEIIRDSLLAVSGRLNLKMFGPGVFVPPPVEVKVPSKDGPVAASAEEQRRRSVYLFARRNQRLPFLEAFDLPDSNQSCPKRERSTTGPQALTLLNGNDTQAAAVAMAKRLEKYAPNEEERIRLAFRMTFGRLPSAEELRAAHEFLRQSPLAELCRALFNANEFVYVD